MSLSQIITFSCCVLIPLSESKNPPFTPGQAQFSRLNSIHLKCLFGYGSVYKNSCSFSLLSSLLQLVRNSPSSPPLLLSTKWFNKAINLPLYWSHSFKNSSKIFTRFSMPNK